MAQDSNVSTYVHKSAKMHTYVSVPCTYMYVYACNMHIICVCVYTYVHMYMGNCTVL